MITIRFVPQDFWIGLYWKTEPAIRGDKSTAYRLRRRLVTTWYLCLLPCLPIIFTTTTKIHTYDPKTKN
jgi:hypothetical protein